MSRRTVKVLVPRSENARAQRIYLIVIGLLIWASSISVLVILFRLIFRRTIDPLGSFLIIVIFLSLSIGLYGILKIKPPLHYLISLGAALNILIAFGSFVGFLQGLASGLLIYIGIRFPIKFEYEKRRLNPDAKDNVVNVRRRK